MELDFFEYLTVSENARVRASQLTHSARIMRLDPSNGSTHKEVMQRKVLGRDLIIGTIQTACTEASYCRKLVLLPEKWRPGPSLRPAL